MKSIWEKTIRNRKPQRLKSFDYSTDGAYFITICTANRENFFGEIVNGKMVLNACGEIAQKCWQEISNHFTAARLDGFIVMPNHIHGIVWIENVGGVGGGVGNKNFCSLRSAIQNDSQSNKISWQTKLSHSISSIIRGFKIGVTKWCRQNNQENFAWQKSFYDRIIRDEEELNRIQDYILNNPANWETDENNFPIRLRRKSKESE